MISLAYCVTNISHCRATFFFPSLVTQLLRSRDGYSAKRSLAKETRKSRHDMNMQTGWGASIVIVNLVAKHRGVQPCCVRFSNVPAQKLLGTFPSNTKWSVSKLTFGLLPSPPHKELYMSSAKALKWNQNKIIFHPAWQVTTCNSSPFLSFPFLVFLFSSSC